MSIGAKTGKGDEENISSFNLRNSRTKSREEVGNCEFYRLCYRARLREQCHVKRKKTGERGAEVDRLTSNRKKTGEVFLHPNDRGGIRAYPLKGFAQGERAARRSRESIPKKKNTRKFTGRD